MKKIIFSLLSFLVMWSSNLSAQEHKWEINLSGIYGRVYSLSENNKWGAILSPSLRYHFTPTWSAEIGLLLPLADKNSQYPICYTTGIEVSFKISTEILPKLRLSLSPLGMLGITGPYEALAGEVCLSLSPKDPHYQKPDIDFQKTRWQIGFRPSLSYELAPRCRLELAYGFLGFRSNKDIDENDIFHGEPPHGAFGFNGEMGWGNSLRLGISYLF